MARYEAKRHLTVGEFSPAPGDPLESVEGDGRDWFLMERVGDVAPWPAEKPWPQGKGIEAPSVSAYAVQDKGRGWFVIVKDDEEVTKSLRADDVEGFGEWDRRRQEEFAAANKPTD